MLFERMLKEQLKLWRGLK